MSSDKVPNERTEPVSIYLADRAQIRAIAGARQTVPARIIRQMLAAYLSSNPRAQAIATAALAEAETAAEDSLDSHGRGK